MYKVLFLQTFFESEMYNFIIKPYYPSTPHTALLLIQITATKKINNQQIHGSQQNQTNVNVLFYPSQSQQKKILSNSSNRRADALATTAAI